MIKDIVVNLPVGKSADVATSFAISLAAKFSAHLTGIAFRYEPLIPVMVDMYGCLARNYRIPARGKRENRKSCSSQVR